MKPSFSPAGRLELALRSLTTALAVLLLCLPAHADPSVQTAWRLLDYIAVDYRGAVQGGEVISQDEYAEMTEFAASARERIDALADTPAKAELQREATTLQQAVANKASAEAIATSARALAARLIEAYPVPLAPTEIPDLALGRQLYTQNCAACHGEAGDGKGPAAASLDPPPIAFADKERAQERSIFGLYQVIEQGLDGTSMPSFAKLPVADRWALAFYVGGFAYPDSEGGAGQALWQGDPGLAQQIDLQKLVGTTPAALAEQLGAEKGDALTAYLRHNPKALQKQPAGSLSLAKSRLDQAVEAYASGDKKAATELALSAYLDGFEPIEPMLASHDPALLSQVEGAMGALRSSIANGAPIDDVRADAAGVEQLFSKVEGTLASSNGSAASSFFGAFAILLREGLEALLIVVAMLSFLRKAERSDVIAYVHGGWVSALLAGVATWGVATWLITITGATREMTEGFGSVFAAMVLLWVGIWMHGKSNAEVWQRYVRESLSKALNRRSAWVLFGLSFLVVYREVFETILFYAAIWSEGNGGAVLAGGTVAALSLLGIAYAMMHYSKVLPIRQFFTYSSSLIAVLAVVLSGKGVAALQEAGYVSVHALVGCPRIELLGLYPTMETAAAQAVMIALLLLGFTYNMRTARAKPAS
jgi:high-affinity iron transporter